MSHSIEQLLALLASPDASNHALALQLMQSQNLYKDVLQGIFPVTDFEWVEGGDFDMGGELSDEESPIHRVSVRSFYLHQTPVTQRQYRMITGENPSYFPEDENRPVESVSWYDAIEFCNRLSEWAGLEPVYTIDKENPDPNNLWDDDPLKWTVVCNWNAKGYRLPTEAEWEYAARGGKLSRGCVHAGSNDLDAVGWWDGNSDERTHPVKRKKPNELGLYDLTGNVLEWCWDWMEAYDPQASDNPKGAIRGEWRVLRGGDYSDDDPSNFRVCSRFSSNPNSHHGARGFRLLISDLSHVDPQALQQAKARKNQAENPPTSVEQLLALLASEDPANHLLAQRLMQSQELQTAVVKRIFAPEDWILINGGRFKMGSKKNADKTIRQVKISDFYLQKAPITQVQYRLLMGKNPATFNDCDACPVEQVSWYDAIECCNRLSEWAGLEPVYTMDKENPDPHNHSEDDPLKWTVVCNWDANGYRLPTEAEWEYAARGGTLTKNTDYAGSNEPEEVAWTSRNADGKTHPVQSKKPNELGLYDLSGNVYEWCWDGYGNYPKQDEKQPKGATNTSERLLRGGAFHSALGHSVWDRYRSYPSHRGRGLGFRLCRNKGTV